jgi:hypothetical protein
MQVYCVDGPAEGQTVDVTGAGPLFSMLEAPAFNAKTDPHLMAPYIRHRYLIVGGDAYYQGEG